MSKSRVNHRMKGTMANYQKVKNVQPWHLEEHTKRKAGLLGEEGGGHWRVSVPRKDEGQTDALGIGVWHIKDPQCWPCEGLCWLLGRAGHSEMRGFIGPLHLSL